MAAKLGRRPLPARKARRHGVLVRFTRSQLELVVRAAGEEPVATWLHREVVALAKRRARSEKGA